MDTHANTLTPAGTDETVSANSDALRPQDTPGAASAQPTLWGRTHSSSQRQRRKAATHTFVDCPDKLSSADQSRVKAIHDANVLGWAPEVNDLVAEFAGQLDPVLIRNAYHQAKREVGGRNYLHMRWLPYKQAKGPAALTGCPGDGRGAKNFVLLIEALRRHVYRSFKKRTVFDSWFEDQTTLGAEIAGSRCTVNRLVRLDPDLQRFVVPVPRRRYECKRSGGASRVAPHLYVVAIEDPLIPDDVAPIRVRFRALLQDLSGATSTTASSEEDDASAHQERFFGASSSTQNISAEIPLEQCSEMRQQIEGIDSSITDYEVRRSPQGRNDFAESSAIGKVAGGFHQDDDNRDGTANGVGIDPDTDDGERVRANGAIDIGLSNPSKEGSSSAAPPASLGAQPSNQANGDVDELHQTDDGDLDVLQARIAHVRRQVANRCYSVLLELEQREAPRNGRSTDQQAQSAHAGVYTITEALAEAGAPDHALEGFMDWLRGRIRRSRRVLPNGTHKMIRKPTGYAITTAKQLIAEAPSHAWACAARDDEEQRVAQTMGNVQQWKERQALEQQQYDDRRARESSDVDRWDAARADEDRDNYDWSSLTALEAGSQDMTLHSRPTDRRLGQRQTLPSGVDLTQDDRLHNAVETRLRRGKSRLARAIFAKARLHRATDGSLVVVAATTFDRDMLSKQATHHIIRDAIAAAAGVAPLSLVLHILAPGSTNGGEPEMADVHLEREDV